MTVLGVLQRLFCSLRTPLLLTMAYIGVAQALIGPVHGAGHFPLHDAAVWCDEHAASDASVPLPQGDPNDSAADFSCCLFVSGSMAHGLGAVDFSNEHLERAAFAFAPSAVSLGLVAGFPQAAYGTPRAPPLFA